MYDLFLLLCCVKESENIADLIVEKLYEDQGTMWKLL